MVSISNLSATPVPTNLSEELENETKDFEDENKSHASHGIARDDAEPVDPAEAEKGAGHASLELTRTTTNALSRISTRLTSRHIQDPGPAPDGGLKAWTQVAMAWLVVVTTWGYLNSFGVFQTYYTNVLGETQSTISWVGSIQTWCIFVISTFSGRALDAGLFVPTLAVGGTIQLIGIFMNSLCRNFWQLLLAQGLCIGIGSGIIFCPSLGLVTTYFAKKRGIAVAIVTTGNSFGGTIYPIMVRQLLSKIGFAWTVRTIGFINLACLATALAFMRPRLPPRKSGPVFELQAFRELPYVCAVAGFALVFGALFFVYYYISSFCFNILHMSYKDSANMIIIFNAIGIPARLLTGHAADRWTGPLNAIIPLIFLNGVLAFTWIAVSSVGGMYVETVVYGLAGGAFQCLFPTTITSLNNDMSKNGVRLGMAFSVFSFAGLTGPPIGGALLTTNGGGQGGYMSALLGVGFATMAGTALLCVSRVRKAGWKLTTKC
jgi:predicted MFS family arabinose efflux permease